MHSDWRCDTDGPVLPLHVAGHVNLDVIESTVARALAVDQPTPLWCPWPLPPGWTVTGIGWAGDDRSGIRGTVLACSGPAPVSGGPGDILLIAEEPGVGLGSRFAGIPGPDPGRSIEALAESSLAHAKVKAAGWPVPLWAVPAADDRSAYVGEAKGLWLYAVTWPATAGYLLAEIVSLVDLTEWVPLELVFGAPTPYLVAEA